MPRLLPWSKRVGPKTHSDVECGFVSQNDQHPQATESAELLKEPMISTGDPQAKESTELLEEPMISRRDLLRDRRLSSGKNSVVFRCADTNLVLRNFGSVWDNAAREAMPGALSESEFAQGAVMKADPIHADADATFFESGQTDTIDCFLSHAWASPRILKALAMLYSVNLNFATAMAFLAWLSSSCMNILWYGFAGMGGMPEIVPRLVYIPVGVFFVSFLFGHHFRSPVLTQRYWLDKICIHQSRSEMKLLGVSALPEFVANSKKMLVLWNESYFERLWCNAEVATFVAITGSAEDIDIQPLWLAPWLMITILMDCVSIYLMQEFFVWIPKCGEFFARFYGANSVETLFLTQFVGIGAAMGAAYMPAVPVNYISFKMKIRNHKLMLDHIANFSIKNAKCAVESDRKIVESHVEQLMSEDAKVGFNPANLGADPLQRFDHLVQTDILASVEAKVGRIHQMPYKLAFLVFLPLVFESLASVLGCDGAPCSESAKGEGYSSISQYQVTNALMWLVGIILIFPATYPIMLSGLAWCFTNLPECLHVIVGPIIIAASYVGMAFMEGLAAALIVNAVTIATAGWVILTLVLLAFLVYLNFVLFFKAPSKRGILYAPLAEEAADGGESVPKLEMTFRAGSSPDSATRVVNFTPGPLGMSFKSNSMPIIVRDVMAGSEAARLGITQGMVIEKIGEEDITQATYNEAFTLMKSKVMWTSHNTKWTLVPARHSPTAS